MQTTTPAATNSQGRQRSTLPEKIRPELNLEKWSLFAPAHSRTKKARTLKREINLPDGSTRTAQVSIDFTERLGTLTTEHKKTLYALYAIWEKRGKPKDFCPFSLREVARERGRRWGKRALDETIYELKGLAGVSIEWVEAFFCKETGDVVELLELFQILAYLKISLRRNGDSVANKAVGYFQFNDLIEKNLLANYTKPLILAEVFNFKSEIALLLYTHIDLIIYRRNHYERNTRELFFDDLGLVAKEYTKKSSRVRKLRKALKELLGVRLSGGGTITTAKAIETNDKHDYKMVIRKNGQQELPLTEAISTTAESRKVETELPEDTITTQARVLIDHFYTLFHNTAQPYPTSKAISQATALIANHGIELARYIIKFAFREVEKTNYHPQTFGGILQYSARAAVHYDNRRQQEKKEQAAAQERALQERYQLYRAGELDRIKATILPDELADIKRAVRAQVEAEGGPSFTFDTTTRVRTETILLDRLQLPSFDEWKADPVPATTDKHSPHTEGDDTALRP